jgi:hypothetical protein
MQIVLFLFLFLSLSYVFTLGQYLCLFKQKTKQDLYELLKKEYKLRGTLIRLIYLVFGIALVSEYRLKSFQNL